MIKDFQDYLNDILQSIGLIEEFVTGLDEETFSQDQKTLFAVVRALEIIGEAAKNIPDSVRKRHPNVPWTLIIAMRNKLIHEYFGIDNHVIWKTIQDDLPILKAALEQCD